MSIEQGSAVLPENPQLESMDGSEQGNHHGSQVGADNFTDLSRDGRGRMGRQDARTATVMLRVP